MADATEVLAVGLAVNGMAGVEAAMTRLMTLFKMGQAAALDLATGFKMIAVASGIAFAGIKQAALENTATARLEGLTGSLEKAQGIMAHIRSIAAEGVFNIPDLIEASRILDASIAGGFEKNIDLVEKLGARMGDVNEAANAIALISQGQTSRVMMRLRESGIGPDKLRAAGLVVEGNAIKNSPAQILEALKQIESHDKTYARLQETFDARVHALGVSLLQLAKTSVEPLLVPLEYVVGLITALATALVWLNNHSFGIPGLVVVVGALFYGMVKVIPALYGIFTNGTAAAVALGKVAATANAAAAAQGVSAGAGVAGGAAGVGLLAGLWARIVGVLYNIYAAATGIWAALTGFFAGIGGVILGAIALATGLALGIIKILDFIFGKDTVNEINKQIHGINPYTNQPYDKGSRTSEKNSENGARRPTRRDNIENVYKRAYGTAWSG